MSLVPSVAIREKWAKAADAPQPAGVKPELWSLMAKELDDEDLTSMMLHAGISGEDYRSGAEKSCQK